MNINTVSLSGYLSTEPELRATPAGLWVLKFCLASNGRKKNASTGQWEDDPTFIWCTMLGNGAQAVSSYLAKGSKVTLQGKLKSSNYEKNGERVYRVEVLINALDIAMATKHAIGQYTKPQGDIELGNDIPF